MYLGDIIDAIEENELSDIEIKGTFKDSMKNDNAVYVTEYDGLKIQFINSSNQKPINDYGSILAGIAEKMEEGDTDGEVDDIYSGNQIWWEVVYAAEQGTLLR